MNKRSTKPPQNTKPLNSQAMNNKDYLDEVQKGAIEVMTDNTKGPEDRFAAMIVAMLAQTYNNN